MRGRWKDGNSAKLVVLFYIDAPHLKNKFTTLPASTLVSRSNTSPVVLPAALLLDADLHAQHWQQGDEYVLFIN